RVQAPQLHHQEEPAQQPGSPGDEEVLPELRYAPDSQRDPLSSAFSPVSKPRPDHPERGFAVDSLLRVPLDESFTGRVYPPQTSYEVSREKIREFADAIGDDNP